MRIRVKFIPSLFTVLNMFAGFLAIVQIFNMKYESAIWLILVAAIFDGLDGKIARFTHNESQFGVEYDSLSDIVSFCLAPSLLVYSLYTSDMGFLGAGIGFLPLLFGGIRLARFNVQTTRKRKSFFTGLPVPGMAITIATYVLFNMTVFEDMGNPRIILPLMVILCFLMISKVRFPYMPSFSFKQGRGNSMRFLMIIGVIIFSVLFPGYFMFPFITAYISINILRAMFGYEEIDEMSEVSNIR